MLDSTIKRWVTKYGLFGAVARRKLHLSQKTTEAQLGFAKPQMDKHKMWNNVLCTNKTKVELFDLNAQHHFSRNKSIVAVEG